MTKKSMQYVASLDIGSTNIKCSIYNKSFLAVHKSVQKIQNIECKDGRDEIHPDYLWNVIVDTVASIIRDAGISADQIACLGISSQRGTFVTWDTYTHVPFHNFITWKDLRAANLVAEWDKSFLLKMMRFICHCLYWLTGIEMFLAAALLKFRNVQVTFRLLWVLQNIPSVKSALKSNRVRFGTIDTWLINKLSEGDIFVTDISNACATGMFNPFQLTWGIYLSLFGIPKKILPNICQTSGNQFGRTKQEIWGARIPITCSMADQSAAAFGLSCLSEKFSDSNMKMSLGTGGFFDIITNEKPFVSRSGLYPLVGWNDDDEVVYMLEGAWHDVGSVIEWALHTGIIKDVQEIDQIELSIRNDVYLLSDISDAIVYDFNKCGIIILNKKIRAESGSKILSLESPDKQSSIQAVMENVVFYMFSVYLKYKTEYASNTRYLWVDGGVSQSDLICQCFSDLSGLVLIRPGYIDSTLQGVALQAGLAAGVWDSKHDINSSRWIDTVFTPTNNVTIKLYLEAKYRKWCNVIIKTGYLEQLP